MKEFYSADTEKHMYATDFEQLQADSLGALQDLHGTLGVHIVSGCEVTANGSNWDIAAGIVCIKHSSDGWKLARFAGVTDKAFPGYLSITKASVNGLYGATEPYTTDVALYNYTADWTDGAASVDDTRLIFNESSSTAIKIDFVDALAAAAKSTAETRTLTVFDTADDLKFWTNRLARTLHVQGDITIKNYNAVVLPDEEYPLFQTALPVHMRPAVQQEFVAHVKSTAVFGVKDFNQSDYIRVVTGYVTTAGLVYLRWVRPANTAEYELTINANLQLD